MFKSPYLPLLTAALLVLGTAQAQAQTATNGQAKPPQAQVPKSPAPQAMNYQGIARDLLGKPLQHKAIALRISVLAGGADAPAVYSELHRVTTTEQGAFSLAVGRGTTTQGTFSALQWGSTNHFLRVEIDPAGGSSFRVMGTSELLSVPYALYAGLAGGVSTDLSKLASLNRPGVPSQVWSLFGNSGVNPLTDRLGTTDAADLVLITNNIDRLTITSAGDILIRNSLGIGRDLTVARDVFLNTAGGSTVNNGPFTVANASPTSLTGLLDVTGATNLRNTLNTVGATTLRSTLGVTGATTLSNTLGVTGATNLSSTLGVTGATALSNSLTVAGATTLNNSLAANGQVTISTAVGGGDGSYGAYPLRVQGSDQGIAIKLNAGTPDNSNNFVTFFNSSGNAVGRIEGQTSAEVGTDPQFIFDNAILVAEEIKAGVNVVLAIIPVVVAGVIASTGPCGACIATAAADLILATANLIAFNLFSQQNLGVTYQSGSADYAEWLERSNGAEKIGAGDIVAVNGGKISKYTSGAQQLMVISTKPAVLGNMPSTGQELNYEKVAFMGQIPVKVLGIVLTGDYILPSGRHDGIGIAVSPKEIRVDQYKQIVGVAWSESLVEGNLNVINMAIGLNSNDLAGLAVEQDKKIKSLESKFSLLEARLGTLEGGAVTKPAAMIAAAPTTAPTKELSRYELLAKNMPAELSNAVMADAIANLKSAYVKQGISFQDNPGLKRLFTDAAFQAEVIHKSQEKYRLSHQTILERSRN